MTHVLLRQMSLFRLRYTRIHIYKLQVLNSSADRYLIERGRNFFGGKLFVHLEGLQPLDGVQREENVAVLGDDPRLRGQNRGWVL